MLRALLVLCVLASSAQAEPWYRGKYGRNRVLHLSLTVTGGILYPATDWLEARIAPTSCNWCSPTSLDRGARGALRWEDEAAAANTASDITAFIVAPGAALGLIALYTPPSLADVIDDLTPIVEAMVVVTWITRGLKLSVARERPYAHYGLPMDHEDNLSFPSGHTSRAFALGTSAAVIAHARGYAIEPAVWIAGMTIGAGTAYLRLAADRHYISDVLSGAALGVAAGLTVPWLMRRELEVVPTRNGVAVAGAW